jgi:predicted CXXCH cytochrome family protein
MIFFFFISVFLLYSNADAVSPDCTSCHTMYNKQENLSETDSDKGNLMLKEGCVSCHTASQGKVSSYGAPVVLHTIAPAGQGAFKTLAGGDFYWVNSNETANAGKGHNVIDLPGITGKDAYMRDFNPPGWDKAATNGFRFGRVAGGEDNWSSQLTCAGKYGCHGDHTKESSFRGVEGAHHNNSGGTSSRASVADKTGNSYRFLGGIKGLENTDWNWNETAQNHNEYYGVNSPANRQYDSGKIYTNRDTISFLCAECHGVLHTDAANDFSGRTPWRRHPTDIALPGGTTEYADYNPDNGNQYSVEAPVAREAVPISSGSTVSPNSSGITGAIVMCLSCHRAHGSNQNDLLRWDYGNMAAGDPNSGGCFTCHTRKNRPSVNL